MAQPKMIHLETRPLKSKATVIAGASTRQSTTSHLSKPSCAPDSPVSTFSGQGQQRYDNFLIFEWFGNLHPVCLTPLVEIAAVTERTLPWPVVAGAI
jgi:hypothetical protein